MEFNTKLAKKLLPVIRAVRRIERFFGPDDDWVERARKNAYERADGLFGHTTVVQKGTADYITTADATNNEVEHALYDAGYQRNFLSTRKYRMVDGEKHFAKGSWVVDNGTTQHHVFLFDAPKGTDIYGHKEPSVSDVEGHLDTSTGTHGDPDRRVARAVFAANISTAQRKL